MLEQMIALTIRAILMDLWTNRPWPIRLMPMDVQLAWLRVQGEAIVGFAFGEDLSVQDGCFCGQCPTNEPDLPPSPEKEQRSAQQ